MRRLTTLSTVNLTVKELQSQLLKLGRPISGRKADLIDRLSRPAPPRRSAPPAARIAIAADPTPRALMSDASTLRIISWNVAGLRGLLRREAGPSSLRQLAEEERADVLLLQETKLQEPHVPEVEPLLFGALGAGEWRAAWSCSTARKGYSGVCTAWRAGSLQVDRCAPLPVHPDADAEGRTLLLEAGPLRLLNVYTPNAGAELKRLAFRTAEGGWDERFRDALGTLSAAAPALVVGGDLNVAVEDADFFNPHERRMARQAGTTPQERSSMRACLAPPLGMRDAFRLHYPEATGCYTYWSQRARNRPLNRGLRLDYFLLGRRFPADALASVQHLPGVAGSDHCPVVLEVDLARAVGAASRLELSTS